MELAYNLDNNIRYFYPGKINDSCKTIESPAGRSWYKNFSSHLGVVH